MVAGRSVRAFIALGANLGDRGGNLRAAIEALGQTPGVRVLRTSQFIETPAVGGPPGSPAFLNAAAEIETDLSAPDLLARLLEVEHQLGRVRRQKWDPRLIDLDLLLYDDEVIDAPALKVPHPLMHRRRFVLKPLAEIAPDVMHPTERRTIRELLENLRD